MKQSNKANHILDDFIKNEDALDFYTDGSNSEGSLAVGYSCVCPKLDIFHSQSINKRASVYTAECKALEQALDFALDNRNKNIAIFSDSLSALQALNSTRTNIHTNPYILEIKKKYFQFTLNNPHKTHINMYWIPSHSGISGNDIADTLAKSKTSSTTIDIPTIPFSDFNEI